MSANFLIVLPAFSKRGLRLYCQTCLLSPRELDSSIPSNLLGGSLILSPDLDHLTTCLVAFFLVALACPSVICDERGSKTFGVTDLLHNREYSPFLLCLMMQKVLTGFLIVPKVPKIIGVSMKFFEGLIHD